MRRLIFRGEIYYMKASETPEVWKPAVVVSNDRNNAHSDVVEVVYITNRDKKDLPTHVHTVATGGHATVLCEQVNSIKKEKLGDFIGLMPTEELERIDEALAISLGL